MSVGGGNSFSVEVVYAVADHALIKAYQVLSSATAADVLALAAADPEFEGIDIAGSAVGLYGRLIPRERVLEPGDRLEIYRALAADPKDARRRRVQRARKQGSSTPGANRAAK